MKQLILDIFSQFGNLSDQEILLIENAYSRAEFKNKQMLLYEGDVCQHIYFIVSGLVRKGIIDKDGNDITTNFRREGEFITNYESFLRGTTSKYFIEALEDTVTLRVDRFSLNELYEKTQIGNIVGRKISENLFIETYSRLTAFYQSSAEERYVEFIETNGSLLNRVAQGHLATYLGIKPQSLSRIKNKYAQSVI